MARKLVVEIVGDASSLQRSFVTANRSAKTFTREMESATRGAISGTGLFKGFGRSIAFASGGFLAFSSVSEFLTKSVDAAREAAVAQRSLAAQMKASGESFDAHRGQVEQATVAYEKFGFTNDEVIQSLTVLERGTGSIQKALRLQGLVADIARAKNIDLASAAGVVAKVFGHQETALRRAVPGLDKNAHGWDLIREAQQRMAGQAAAGTTVSERFAATLHNTQEIIGTALLPTLNRYLTSLTKALQKMNESGRLQRDLNGFMTAAKPILDNLATSINVLADAFGGLGVAIDKIPKPPSWLGKFAGAFPMLFPAKSLQSIISYFQGPGGGAAAGKGSFFAGIGNAIEKAFKGALTAVKAVETELTKPAHVYPAGMRNQWFDTRIARQLDRVQDLSLRKQLTRLQAIAAEVKARISITKDVTRRNNLEDQYVQILREEKSVQSQITDQMKQQNQALRDRADAIKSAIISRLEASQQRRDDAEAVRQARETLRVYQRIGGPGGIAAARAALGQALTQQQVDLISGKTARLTRLPGGGQAFALGNVITINVHGSESPAKVASEVVAIIKRRERHTTTQQRGPGG